MRKSALFLSDVMGVEQGSEQGRGWEAPGEYRKNKNPKPSGKVEHSNWEILHNYGNLAGFIVMLNSRAVRRWV